MAKLLVEACNDERIEKKPPVFFTCHPDDFDLYFTKICADIFKSHDCAIYYTENMNEPISKEDMELDIGRSNLLVIPVTFRLLSSSNRTMDVDLPFAITHNIPILPIVMEPGLDRLYSHPQKFNEIQYISCCNNDATTLPYDERLKKYLDTVLLDGELIEKVRAAFVAYIFLSYRKMDRVYANSLLQLIHSKPELRDVAVWFDEFLTPGESFKVGIEQMIEHCDLFSLLVTPHVFDKVVDNGGELSENYVMAVELPMAQKKKAEKGSRILAVEMQGT